MYAKRYVNIKKAQKMAEKEKARKNNEFKPTFKTKYNGKRNR